MKTKAEISDTLQAIEHQSYAYYQEGDGTDSYHECIREDISDAIVNSDRASQWLRASLDLDYYDVPSPNSAAVKVYQQWLDSEFNKWHDCDTIVEPEFSGNEYWASRDTLTGYSLPEYDTVDQETDYAKYPRVSQFIFDDSSSVDIYDNQLVVWLSGNIVYKPTTNHRRAARLIMKLYGDK